MPVRLFADFMGMFVNMDVLMLIQNYPSIFHTVNHIGGFRQYVKFVRYDDIRKFQAVENVYQLRFCGFI